KPAQFDALATRLANAGIAVTTLPATDLFLMGQDATENMPRGVAPAHRLLDRGVNCSISTNNVLNPFTPYGDCSLLRIANLFANVAQIADDPGLIECFRMITDRPATLMRQDYGIRVGAPADLVIFDATSPNQAVAELAPALTAFKNGHHLFTRTLPTLEAPPR
ncbi:MAG: amidohydrolase family protein, partial [Janthinobacterium lividum]